MFRSGPSRQSRSRSPNGVTFTIGTDGDMRQLYTGNYGFVRINNAEYSLPPEHRNYLRTGSLLHTQLVENPLFPGTVMVIPLSGSAAMSRTNSQHLHPQFQYSPSNSAPMSRVPSGNSNNGGQPVYNMNMYGPIPQWSQPQGGLYTAQDYIRDTGRRPPLSAFFTPRIERRCTRASQPIVSENVSDSSSGASWTDDGIFYPKEKRRHERRRKRDHKKSR